MRGERPRHLVRWAGRTGKALGWMLLLALIIPVAALQIMRLPGGRAGLRRIVLSQTKRALPGLSFGSISGDLTNALEITDVVLNDRFGGEAIRVARVGLRYQLAPLSQRLVLVDAVELLRPRVRVQPTKSGAMNLAELVVPSPTEPEPSSGPFDWRIRVGALRIDDGELVLAVKPGQPVRISDLSLRATLRMEPGQGPAGLHAALQLDHLAARVTLADERTVDAELRGDVSTGKDLAAKLDVKATIDRARRARLQLRATGPLERLVLDLKLRTLQNEGLLHMSGWAGLVGDSAPRYDLTLALQRFDPRALLVELPRAEANLRLRLFGKGVPPAPGSRAQLELSAGPLRAMGYELDSLALRASADGQAWRLDELRAAASAARLRLSLSGTGDLSRGKVRWQIIASDLGHLPLPKGTPQLRGSLRLRGEGRGRFAGPLSAKLSLLGENLALATTSVQRLQLDGELRGLQPNAASPAAMLTALRGALTVRAARIVAGPGAPRIDRAEVQLSGEQRALSLSASADAPAAGIKAAVLLRANVGSRRAVVTLQSLNLRARGQTVALRNQPEVRYGYRGDIVLDELRLGMLGGEVAVRGSFAPRAFPRLVGALRFAKIRVPKGPRLSGKLQATIDDQAISGQLAARVAGLPRPIALAARLPARYRRGAPLPLPDEDAPLSLSLEIPPLPLALLQRYLPKLRLGGAAGVKAAVSGTLREPRAEATLRLQRARWAPFVADATGRLSFTSHRSATRVEADVALNGRPGLRIAAALAGGGRSLAERLSRGVAVIEQLGAKLRVDVPLLDLALLQPLHPDLGRLRGALFAHVASEGTLARSKITLRAGLRDLAIDGQRAGNLAVQALVDLARDRVGARFEVIENGRTLLSGTAASPLGIDRLRTGSIPGGLKITTDARILRYPIVRLVRLVDPQARASGTLSGVLSLRGDARAPVARGELALRRMRFGDAHLGDLSMHGRFAANRAEAQLRFYQPRGNGSLTGRATVDLRRQQLAARVAGSRIDLGSLKHLVPTIRQSAGKLDLDLRVSGPFAAPQLRGRATLTKGVLRVTGLPEFSNLHADVSLTPDRVTLRRLHLESGGILDAEGDVRLHDLSPRAFSLDAKAKDLRLTFGNIKNARFNGPIAVRGSVERNRLEARVVLDESRLRIPEISGGAELHPTSLPKDVVFVDERGRAAAAKEAPAEPRTKDERPQRRSGAARASLSLAVQTTPLFVNGKDADVEVQTDVKVTTDPQGRPRIHGRVRLRRGWVRILKHRYEVEEALLLFSGEPEPNPALQISLSHRFPEAQIFIDLSGTAHAPKLDLRSEPPIYDRSQILSLILTGRVAPFETGSEVDRSMAVAGAVSQVLLGGIADWLAPKVGLDVASISLDPQQTKSGETRVRARSELGKFVTERLYLGYRHVWGADAEENQNEGLLEYRITARWLLLTVFGDAGVGGLDLFWIYRY